MPEVPGTTLNSSPLDQRFGVMTNEVRGMLSRYPGSVTPNTQDYINERQRLAANGYTDQEQDAIMNTFAIHHGQSSANYALHTSRPSYAEGQIVAPNNAYVQDEDNKLNPPAPFGHINPPDIDQFFANLIGNQMRVGREPLSSGYRAPWAGTDL